MLRLGSRSCVLALHRAAAVVGLVVVGVAALACKPDAGTGSLGSPNASAAGRESANPSSATAATSKVDSTGGLARSLVAVAATSPSEAQPCERTCGRVGDCLLESRDVGEFESGRLELECLDLCVHSPASDGPRSAFLACEQQSSCGEFLGCARAQWDALVATRTGPSVQGVTRGGDSCAEGCLWLYACISTGMPPGQAYLEPQYEDAIRGCEAQCEASQPGDRESYAHFADCLRDNCSLERQNVCFENYY